MALEEGRFFTGSISDRRHNADGLAEYCKKFLSSGVWELGDNLKVTAAGGMAVSINYGDGLVDGYPYRLFNNGTGLLTLPIEGATSEPRIDRIVIRKDITAQRIYACIKKGVPASSPSPPELLSSELGYEISIAKIAVGTGITEITTGNITDERNDDLVCGCVTSNIGIKKVLFQELLLAAHPIGSIYESDDSTSPAIIFGGTWAIKAPGRTLVGVDSNDNDFNAAGNKGGSKTHTNTIPEMAEHYHTIPTFTYVSGQSVAAPAYAGNWAGGPSFNTGSTGGGNPWNIMNPYETTYRWKRTA